LPERPKGMWWRTYRRQREQALEAEMLANEVFVTRMTRLLARMRLESPGSNG